MRKIMEDEIINYKSIETENLIEPVIGETGYMTRETLKKQDEKRITNEIVNGVFRPIGKVGNVALQLALCACLSPHPSEGPPKIHIIYRESLSE